MAAPGSWVLGHWLAAGCWLLAKLTESGNDASALRSEARKGREGDMSKYIDQQEVRALVHDERFFKNLFPKSQGGGQSIRTLRFQPLRLRLRRLWSMVHGLYDGAFACS